MECVVLLGDKANSRLFWIKRDEAEKALGVIVAHYHAFKSGQDCAPTFEIRDDYGGMTVMLIADFKGYTLNDTEGDTQVSVENAIAKALAQTQTNVRIAQLGQSQPQH